MTAVGGLDAKQRKMSLTLKRETTEASGRTPPRMLLAVCALHHPSRLEGGMPFSKSAFNTAHLFCWALVRTMFVAHYVRKFKCLFTSLASCKRKTKKIRTLPVTNSTIHKFWKYHAALTIITNNNNNPPVAVALCRR